MSKCSKRTKKTTCSVESLKMRRGSSKLLGGPEADSFRFVWNWFLFFGSGRDSNPPDCLPRLYTFVWLPPLWPGVLHRDLKPENVLFLTPSVDSPVKVIDFGLLFSRNSWGFKGFIKVNKTYKGHPAIRNPSKFACQQGLYSHVICFFLHGICGDVSKRVGLVFIVDLKSWRWLDPYISMRSMS